MHVNFYIVCDHLVAKCAEVDAFDESRAHSTKRFSVVHIVVTARYNFADRNLARIVAIHHRTYERGRSPAPDA
jgi:hypothetical protein